MEKTNKIKINKTKLMDNIRKVALRAIDEDYREFIKNDLTDRVHADFVEYGVSEDDVWEIVCDVVCNVLDIDSNNLSLDEKYLPLSELE